jgi:ABC-type multidrug transport system fused ATPase/permease subunit
MPSYRNYAQMLIRYVRPYWRWALLLAAVLFSSIGLQLVNPQIVRGFIDAAQSGGDLSKLLWAGVIFFGVGITTQGLNLVATWLSTQLGFSATNALRADLARHLLGLDMSFHKERTPGELIERIDGDVTALSNFFSQFVIRLLGSILIIVGVLALLYREDWRIGLALTSFCALSLVILNQLRNVAVKQSDAERQASAEMFGFVEERLGGLDDIRANGSAAYTMRRWIERMRSFFHASRAAWLARSTAWRTMMIIFGLAQVMTLGVGAWLYRLDVLTIGAVYLVYNYTFMLFDPLERIAHQIQDLQKAAAGIGRVRGLMLLKPGIVDGELSELSPGALPLAFDGVSFAYPDGDDAVLQGVSFHLQPGAKLGLLGRTGSGKTTLTRLLFRLYEPTTGHIRLGPTELRSLTLDCLRQRVGMVTQDVQLFKATVRDNLTFFDPLVLDEQIVAVLRELGLGEWLDRLPKGLDTELAARGDDLSAGEAQLLAFARVFLRDPGLVVLDEPSSRLDPATEALLERAMNRLLHGRTGIVIAHRLATVQRVDEIMIMEDGHVQEHGRRETLVRDPGSRFAQLLRTGLEEAIA